MSQMTIRAPSVATFESFETLEVELPALSRASSSSGSSSASSALPLTPSTSRASDIFVERGPAQSPIQFDALRTFGAAASKRPTRPLVGLGYDFLPSIHVVLAEAKAEEDVINDDTKEAALDTPACNALFNTPYVDALFDVLSPVAEERDGKLSQLFCALVSLVTGLVPGLWLACHGAMMLIRPREGRDVQTVVCVLCAAFVLGLGVLVLLSLLGVVGAATVLRTYLDL